MDSLAKAHAFNVGYEVCTIATSEVPEQTQVLEVIQARLDFLNIPIESLQDLFYVQNGKWVNLQDFFQKVMGRLQGKHGDVVASHFILPVNVLVLISNLPIQDFAAIEAALDNIDLTSALVAEFQNIKHKYNVGVYDRRDPQPLVGWIKKVHEHFLQVIAKGSYEKPHDAAIFSVKELFMGDKIDFSNSNITNSGGQMFLGKVQDVIANLNASGKQEFGNALTNVKNEIEKSDKLSEAEKQEVLELVNQIGEQAAKTKPNKTMLQSLGDGLLKALQAVPGLVKVAGVLIALLPK